ncbi:hypothetical protein PO902_05710 [Planococcus maritimus]|nr:hypothetical protein [Planococcus sp. SK3692]MDE4084542.1 hypothetical protein [Planococcus maritimus]
MKVNNLKENTPYIIIGVLIMIIASLVLTLVNNEVRIIPAWFPQSIFTGVFTLGGAYLGASYAGKFTLKSVNEQISFEKQLREREEVKRNQNSIRIINDEIMMVLSTMESLIYFLEKSDARELQVSLSKQVIEYYNEFNFHVRDNSLMMNISNDHFFYVSFIKKCSGLIISICEFIQKKEFEEDVEEQQKLKGALKGQYKSMEAAFNKIRNQ